jgi:hypothetical protein
MTLTNGYAKMMKIMSLVRLETNLQIRIAGDVCQVFRDRKLNDKRGSLFLSLKRFQTSSLIIGQIPAM